MTQRNPDNERIKRRYLCHLREAEGLSEKTIDHACRAIADFEAFTDWQPFKRFSEDDAVRYKKRLMNGPGKRSIETNARTTIHSKLIHLEKFFTWLAEQPGFRTALTVGQAKYFKLPRKDRKLASERQPKPAPSLDQVQKVIRGMPASTDVELRNRALIACLLLTGAPSARSSKGANWRCQRKHAGRTIRLSPVSARGSKADAIVQRNILTCAMQHFSYLLNDRSVLASAARR
jgi:site-specific recombinase XerD